MSEKTVRFRDGTFLRLLSLFLAVVFLNVLSLSTRAAEPEDGLPLTEDNEAMTGAFTAQNTPALLADSREDPNYILVEKTFFDLPAELIPDGFRVTVSSEAGGVYTLDRENTLSRTTDVDGNAVWRWKITDVGTGTYTVSEAGETVADYTVVKSGEGTVEVKAADMTVLVPVHETTCSHTNWPVRVDGDDNVLFAATLTQGGVAVISKSPLSASQRAAVSQAVLKINGPWKNPVYFYSIEEQIQNGTGFELNGATITYDASAEEVIIGRTRNWQHVATLKYAISEADNPEISLCNSYTRAVAEVTVQKAATGSMADRKKSFAFTVSVQKDGADAVFSLNGTAYTGRAGFSLKHGDSVLLKNVPVGAQITVTEDDYTGDRYETSCTVDHGTEIKGNTASVSSVTAEGHSILFTNRKDGFPDTGVRLDTLPYILILGAVSVGSALLLFRRHGKRNGR